MATPGQARSISLVEDHWPQLPAGAAASSAIALASASRLARPMIFTVTTEAGSVECRGCIVAVEVRFNARVLTISELARRSGFATPTLRFYERKELLWPAKRPGRVRVYDDTAVDRVATVILQHALAYPHPSIAACPVFLHEVRAHSRRMERGRAGGPREGSGHGW
jgi:hypothetical protein